MVEVRFTTGERKTKSPLRPKIVAHADYAAGDWARLPCRELLAAQGCFDSAGERPARVHAFELASSSAIAWYVRANKPDSSLIWPNECGSPRVRVTESMPDECFDVRAVGIGGRLGPAVEYCAKPEQAGKPLAQPPSAAGLSPRSPSRMAGDVPSAQIAAPAAVTQLAPPAPVSPAKAPASGGGGCSVDSHANTWPSAWLIALPMLVLWRRRCRVGYPAARTGRGNSVA